VREVFAENEHLKTEMAELRQRLEVKERNELKLDQKIKALERVINGTRTPAKENIRPIISDNDVICLCLKVCFF
jgi:regulator of replication initiation timing